MNQKKTTMWWMVVAVTVALSVVLQGRWCHGCVEDERLALLQLQDSIKGTRKESIIGNHSFLFEESIDDCCRWSRVECNPVSGRIIELSLNFSRRRDHWQPNASLFLSFRELTRLYLPGNHITGFVGRLSGLTSLEILSAIPSLRILDLSFNSLMGSVSLKGVCQLKHLQELDISSNNLYGGLPSCLANLTSLRRLDLSDNHFTGDMMANSPLRNLLSLKHLLVSGNNFQIPISLTPFFNHSNLQKLEARNNYVAGVYAKDEEHSPDSLVPKFQLRTLDLSSSQSLPGQPLPKFLYHQKHLQFLDLSHDLFQGGFPSWLLENNTNLVQLILTNNSLSGPLLLPNHPHLRLSSLDISSNALEGKLPSNLAESFPRLKYVNMSDNGFMGRIPNSIGRMNYLGILALSNNRLVGSIPTQLEMSSASYANGTVDSNNHPLIWFNVLYWLQLDGNLLSGRIPDSLANCTSLGILDLSNNNLSGQIPNWIPDSYLHVLDLSQNRFSGFLPKGIFSPYMEEVYLSKNQLEGPLNHLPLDYNLYQLRILDLSHNNLTGIIPGWIQMYFQLTYLLLNNNKFHGPIPMAVCKLEILHLLDLSHNNFSGRILPCIRSSSGWSRWEEAYLGPLKPLEFTTKGLSHSYRGTILFYISGIDLSNNNLTGEVPPEFSNFTNIKVLNLSHNCLTGSIPTTFSNLKQIESLDLSYNSLNGTIPDNLVELNFLASFCVAHNNLSGKTLGKVAQFGTFDESSYQGNDLLCGWPLPKDCPGTRANDGISETLPRNCEEGGGGFIDMGAFRVSFSGSYLVMLLGVVTVLWVNPYWRRAWFYGVEVAAASCYYFVVDHLPVPVQYKVSHPRCF